MPAPFNGAFGSASPATQRTARRISSDLSADRPLALQLPRSFHMLRPPHAKHPTVKSCGATAPSPTFRYPYIWCVRSASEQIPRHCLGERVRARLRAKCARADMGLRTERQSTGDVPQSDVGIPVAGTGFVNALSFRASTAGSSRPWMTWNQTEDERSRMKALIITCLLYTSPSPRDLSTSRMPSSA